MQRKTLTLKPAAEPPAETTPAPQTAAPIAADRYFTAREQLRKAFYQIFGNICPAHEVKLTEDVLNNLDEIITAAIDMRFDREFGAPDAQQPFNPNE